jgi:hypothetical protein
MEARQRRQRLLLGGLAAVLGLIVVVQFWPAGEPTTTPARTRREASAARGGTSGRGATGDAASLPQVVDVQVARLSEVPPEPASTGRNPFRFQPKAPPPPPPSARPPGRPSSGNAGGSDAGEPGAPPPPPPPPPIALKFIGVVSGERSTGKVAVLSDGKFVYYGREGEIIEGRYRVVRIGEESVQMEYVDGRGRQTIRLSGA